MIKGVGAALIGLRAAAFLDFRIGFAGGNITNLRSATTGIAFGFGIVEVTEIVVEDPDVETTAGPLTVERNAIPDYVLLTVDSMGDADPALVAHPELPVVFVFNEEALRKLQLSSKRIFFYLETLQDLAKRREVIVYMGDPYQFASENAVAVTYAPVPSFVKFTNPAEVYPFLWLRKPHAKSVRSFSAWRGK